MLFFGGHVVPHEDVGKNDSVPAFFLHRGDSSGLGRWMFSGFRDRVVLWSRRSGCAVMLSSVPE